MSNNPRDKSGAGSMQPPLGESSDPADAEEKDELEGEGEPPTGDTDPSIKNH